MSPRPTPVAGSRGSRSKKEQPAAPDASEVTTTGTRTGRTRSTGSPSRGATPSKTSAQPRAASTARKATPKASATRDAPSGARAGGGRWRRRSTGATPAQAADRRVIGAADRFRRRMFTWQRAVAALLVLALVGAAVWTVYFSTLLTVRSIRVIGTARQNPAAVRELLRPEVGRPLARVDLSVAAQRVVNLPAVRSVQVARAWPNELEVRVVERIPVAVVAAGSGVALLDIQGFRMATAPKAPAGLPVVTPATVRAGNGPTRAVVQSLSGLTPALRTQVRTAQARSQDSVTFTLKSGATVKWGSSEDSARKAEVLAVLLSRVKARMYDVTAPGTPVTK